MPAFDTPEPVSASERADTVVAKTAHGDIAIRRSHLPSRPDHAS